MGVQQIPSRVYRPPRSLVSFFSDTENLVQAAMGPVGSGKTSTMCMRARQLMRLQRPGPDGVRRTRGAVVRSTYSRLDTTSLITWDKWIPQAQYRAPIRMTMPRQQHLRFMDGGSMVDCLVWFMALESDADIEKLKSLELTWLWFHEATELSEGLFDVAMDRIKRFPAPEEGGSNVWKILLDYNPPDQDHWLYRTFELDKPKGFRLWKQPAALLKDENGTMVSRDGTRYSINPEADNLANLDPTYYDVSKKTDRFINIYYLNNYGFAENARPVYEIFNDRLHYADQDLIPYPGLPLMVGMDFGMTPSAVLAQFTPKGQLRVLEEVLPDADRGMGVRQFINGKLKPILAQRYPNFKVHGWGDPNGVRRGDANEKTCFQELREAGYGGIKPAPVRNNGFLARKEAVEFFLGTLVDGQPAIILSNRCPVLRAGFLGKYHFARVEKHGETGIFTEEPVKNHPVSDVHDGLQYLCQGIRGPMAQESEMRQRVAGVERYNRKLAGVG